ncbi:TPA: hypothetical protein ACJPZJ_001591 [Yersinia enterocolitica]
MNVILVGKLEVSPGVWLECSPVQVRGLQLVLLYQSWGLRRVLLLVLYWGDLLPVLRLEPLPEHRLMGSCLTGINVTTVNTHLIDYITFVFHLTEKHFSIISIYSHYYVLLLICMADRLCDF